MTQPEALRLEDVPRIMDNANAELRRLHEENGRLRIVAEMSTLLLAQRSALLEALKWLDRWMSDKTMPECRWKVRGTIEAVEGENHAKSL